MPTGSTPAVEITEEAPSPGGITVLVADKFEQAGLDNLQSRGCLVQFDPDLAGKSLEAAIDQHDPGVLVVRSTKVPATVLDNAGRHSLVVRAVRRDDHYAWSSPISPT